MFTNKAADISAANRNPPAKNVTTVQGRKKKQEKLLA
jgi:hypothetical protein